MNESDIREYILAALLEAPGFTLHGPMLLKQTGLTLSECKPVLAALLDNRIVVQDENEGFRLQRVQGRANTYLNFGRDGSIAMYPMSYPVMTKERAMQGSDIHGNNCSRSFGPKGRVTDTVKTLRANGQCKTWKRNLARFRLPVKFGQYSYDYVTEQDVNQCHAAQDCPLHALPNTRASALQLLTRGGEGHGDQSTGD